MISCVSFLRRVSTYPMLSIVRTQQRCFAVLLCVSSYLNGTLSDGGRVLHRLTFFGSLMTEMLWTRSLLDCVYLCVFV